MAANRCLSVYGNVQIEQAYCEKCDSTAFVIDNRIQCCGAKVDHSKKYDIKEYDNVSFVSEGSRKRKLIPSHVKRIILEFQDNSCFYCRKKFGLPYTKRGKNDIKYTKAVFDHVVPFVHCQNVDHNLVAACNLCNSFKSDKIFSDFIQIMTWAQENLNRRYKFL